jgi:hypothetical protein
MAKMTMDQWITEVMNDTSKDGRISAIVCFHREGTREQEVFAHKAVEGQKIDALELANLFIKKAETHVQDIAGFQGFYLKAFYAGRQEYQARLPFQIENAANVSYGSTEPPTEEGRRQQSMRHGEANFQIYITQATNLANIQNTLIRQLSEDRTKLMSENIDMANVFKEMIFQQATRNHEFEMSKLKFQRESKWIETGLQVGPSLINRLAGKEIIPEAVADTKLIEALLENVDPSKMVDALKEMSIPQEIAGALIARAADHWKKKQAAEEMAIEAVKDREDPILKAVK